jgi:hypothetical protein
MKACRSDGETICFVGTTNEPVMVMTEVQEVWFLSKYQSSHGSDPGPLFSSLPTRYRPGFFLTSNNLEQCSKMASCALEFQTLLEHILKGSKARIDRLIVV